VVDLGVGGYGTDQIYLMFKETYQNIPNSQLVLLGILVPDDIDRAVLSIRTSQKPYFVPDEEGNLQLKGVPIDNAQDRYFREYSLSFKSYLFAFLKRTFVKNNEKAELKKRINSRMLELVKSETDSAGMDLIVVMFYPPGWLPAVSWQESWLKDKLNELGVPFIVTKEIILSYAKENLLDTADLYDEGGHHNDLGNQVVAEGILRYLNENNRTPLRQGSGQAVPAYRQAGAGRR
jgi:hypothetical protein